MPGLLCTYKQTEYQINLQADKKQQNFKNQIWDEWKKFHKKYAKIYKAYNYMQKRPTKIQNIKTDHKISVQFSLCHTCFKNIFPKDLANTVICRPVGGL